MSYLLLAVAAFLAGFAWGSAVECTFWLDTMFPDETKEPTNDR